MTKDVNQSKSGVEKDKKEQKPVEITFISAGVGEGKEILDKMMEGKSIVEYSLEEPGMSMSIKLDDNGIDKDGNRFDLETKYIISIKGNTEKPKTKQKANISPKKQKGDDDLTH